MVKISLVVSFVAVTLSGCTALSTEYQVPDYYDARPVLNDYEVAKVYYIDHLQCSQRRDKCNDKQQVKSKEWVSHRAYSKPYYFE